MKEKNRIIRKLFLGFIQIHILHHCGVEEVNGVWLMQELEEHGYSVSPGTLYPLLQRMEKDGLLSRQNRVVRGKTSKFYRITPLGRSVLAESVEKAKELFHEIAQE